MKTFKEYYEEQQVIEEGLGNIIGKILGIGTVSVLSAWMGALLIKGGIGAINSIANSFGKAGIKFKKIAKEEKDSPAAKNQLNKLNEDKEKYKEDIAAILEAIKQKKWEEAGGEYLALPIEKRNSTEIRRIIVAEIVAVTNQLPVSEPTPGNECYKAIKSIMGLAIAKSLSKAIQEQAKLSFQNQGF